MYAVKGAEVTYHTYKHLYPKLSGAKLIHVKTYGDLVQKVEEEFCKEHKCGP